MAEPAETLDWVEGNPDFATIAIEPSPSKKQTGWLIDEKPPREYFNWMFWNIDQWIKYLAQKVAAQDNQYDAIIASDGSETHASLALALADSGIVAGSVIYIKDSAAISSTIQITKNDIHLIFKNGVTYSKGSAVNALQVSANRVVIEGGRFTGFNGGGDAAIKVDGTALYTIFNKLRFVNNTEDIQELATDPTSVSALIVNET